MSSQGDFWRITTRGDTQLDLLFTGKEMVTGDEAMNVSLGRSNHEMEELKMLRKKGESQCPDPGLFSLEKRRSGESYQCV